MTSILSRPTRGEGDPAKFQKFFRRRRLGGPKKGPNFWMLSKKWTPRGLRWLQIGPKSKVIVNAEYYFFILGPEGLKYTNVVQKPQFWTKSRKST